jgi:hypothetical protein
MNHNMEYFFSTILKLVIILPIVICEIVNYLKSNLSIVVFPNIIQREAI